ncbi:MAG: metallophosphoesterase family protein [Terriglobales bacterium]
MAILLLSDIHGNWEALAAVAAQAEALGAMDCYCLGDVVGYGADPNACTAWVQAHAALTIRGNHDRVCVAPALASDFNPIARAAVEWTASQLRPEARDFLAALPSGPIAAAEMTLAHGSPLDEDEYLILPQQAAAPLVAVTTVLTWIGHTHIQGGFVAAGGRAPAALMASPSSVTAVATPQGPGISWRLALQPETRYLLNPGSVGQPRDGDPRAAFAVYEPSRNGGNGAGGGPSGGEVCFYRIPYDHLRAAEKILAAGLPPQLAHRLARGR